MYKFGESSLNKLATCHPDLQNVANKVMELQLFDFGIIWGVRTKEEQFEAFRMGKSSVMYPNSKHNLTPSHAFDFALWLNGKIDWSSKESYYMAVGTFIAVGKMLGITLKSGGDWNRNWYTKDQTFNDLGHIELVT